MAKTSIEWATDVWNPTTGCDRVSPGCDHCYAMTLAKRLKGMGSAKYQTDGDPRTSGPGFGLALHEDTLSLPLTWRKPRRVFVNSMSDLFHEKVPDQFIANTWHRFSDVADTATGDWSHVPDWFRQIRDQCLAAGVAYLHKQNGGIRPKSNGRLLDGRTWDQYPTAGGTP